MQQALPIQEAALGANHPAVASSLIHFALLFLRQNNSARAVPLLSQATEVEETNMALTLSIGSESRKRNNVSIIQNTTDVAISLHLQGAITSSEAARLALTTILRRKGRILDAVTSDLQTLRQHLTPADQQLLDQLQAARSQLANLP